MCYTIEVYLSRKAIENRFSVDTSILNDFDFRYFYAAFNNPFLPVVTQDNPGEVQLMQWGLIPHWTKDAEHAQKISRATYNARSETLHEKASFRLPFKSRRCWVIAHGFFEWQQINNQKLPYYIKLNNDAPFVFAGLYDFWVDKDTGEQLNTFSVITTRANPLMEKIHNTKKRMPVILDAKKEKRWIDPVLNKEEAQALMLPFPEKEMIAHPVMRNINKAGTDHHSKATIEPVNHPTSGSLF